MQAPLGFSTKYAAWRRTNFWRDAVQRRMVRAALWSLAALCSHVASAHQLTFTWSDNSDNESGFRVERSRDGRDFEEVATVAANVVRYVDAGLSPATTYWYRARAFNLNGASGYTTLVRGTTASSAGTAPTITGLADTSIPVDSFAGPLAFTIGDADTPLDQLVLSATSSNSEIVHPARIVFGGSGAQRTVTVRPLAHRSGSVRITVTVSDGRSSISEHFQLAVSGDAPAAQGARLRNLSTRVQVRGATDPAIAGFVVGGTSAKRVLLRIVGPTLGSAPFGLRGVLPDPRVVLKQWGGSRGYLDRFANNDWDDDAGQGPALRRAMADAFAFALPDASRDAALVVELPPGQYSAVADDVTEASGVALLELYDLDDLSSDATLTNLSTRGFVGSEDQVMITGFVLAGGGTQTVLLRAVGPALAAPPFKLAATLADPEMQLYRRNTEGTDTLIMTQDNWGGSADASYTAEVAARVSAFPLPTGSKDAAFVVTLPAGVYTVVVRGADGGTGAALAEVYAVP